MFMLFIFVIGYLLGGITALIVIALTIAARRGDSGTTISAPPEETVAAWRSEG
jgi:hypothetical protein